MGLSYSQSMLCNGSHALMAKPIKTLQLNNPIIQFLTTAVLEDIRDSKSQCKLVNTCFPPQVNTLGFLVQFLTTEKTPLHFNQDFHILPFQQNLQIGKNKQHIHIFPRGQSTTMRDGYYLQFDFPMGMLSVSIKSPASVMFPCHIVSVRFLNSLCYFFQQLAKESKN